MFQSCPLWRLCFFIFMKNKVLTYIQDNQLLLPGESVIAGFSGGADSTALLVILSELKDILKIRLSALHVHHGIRGEAADEDEAFCREFCRERQIEYRVKYVETIPYANEQHMSLEEAARDLRYRAFTEVLQETGADKIVLAHHKNDQAETVLFHMIRGSSLKGLSGMRPERGFYVRPLLCVTREEIRAFLKEQDILWREDETNREDTATRNFLRHRVVPELKQIRRDSVEKIADTADYLREVDEYLGAEARKWISENTLDPEPGTLMEIDRRELSKIPKVLKEYILSEMLRISGLSLKDVTRKHLFDAAALAEKPVGKETELPRGIRFVTTYRGLSLKVKEKKDPARKDKPKELPEMVQEIKKYEKGMKIPDLTYTKWFDCAKINGPVILRQMQAGDRIAVKPGKHKKLTRFFIDEKIPLEERKNIPVIACGSDILWVVGYRMSEDHKISENTQKVLEIRIIS